MSNGDYWTLAQIPDNIDLELPMALSSPPPLHSDTAVPRWFYGTLAGCAVVMTVAVVYALAFRSTWVPMTNAGDEVLNTHTRDVCVMHQLDLKAGRASWACATPILQPLPR